MDEQVRVRGDRRQKATWWVESFACSPHPAPVHLDMQ